MINSFSTEPCSTLDGKLARIGGHVAKTANASQITYDNGMCNSLLFSLRNLGRLVPLNLCQLLNSSTSYLLPLPHALRISLQKLIMVLESLKYFLWGMLLSIRCDGGLMIARFAHCELAFLTAKILDILFCRERIAIARNLSTD